MKSLNEQRTIHTESGEQIFNPRRLFPELSCPAEHAAFAALWARQIVPGANMLAGHIKQSMGELHLSDDAQKAVAKAHQLAEMLHVELRNIQFNTDQEMNGFEQPREAVSQGASVTQCGTTAETQSKTSAPDLSDKWVCTTCNHARS